MKKKHIIYTLSTIPLAITLGNVNDSNAFFGLDSFIARNRTVSDVVDIKDKNLLKAINNQLGRGEVMDSVTVADMESLTVLNAQERNISSIEGIEYAVNLRELNLGSNKLANISSLRSLTQLTKLYIYDNQISDISPLGSLVNLKDLQLGNNQISDISVLGNLTDLVALYLGNNQILNISTLDNLINLNFLQLSSNRISDISALDGLINLKTLHLQGNQISDISNISNLINLNCLYLHKNQISDVSDISNLINLKDLRLDNNRIIDISPLSNLTNLKVLYLNDNQILDILDISNLINLNNLYLQANQISDISPLSNLIDLKDLRISNNQISDVSPINNLINLNILHSNNNQISDISDINNLTNLNTLYLQNNQISDISDISNLINLKDLRLDNNRIIDISPLSNLTNLKVLYLNDNQILDILDISNLINLNNLYLQANQISDISPLSNLIDLKDLRISNNQISDVSSLSNLVKLKTLALSYNQIIDISPVRYLTNLTSLGIVDNKVFDISPLKDLKNLTKLTLSNQKPIIEAGDFKSEADKLDISINNPIIGLNNRILNISSISNNGIYEHEKLKWNNVSLGNHTRTFNFSENIIVGSATATFSGTATLNFNVVDGVAPETDHTSEFDNNDFGIYITVTAEDLGTGVDYLMHGGVRQSLPYRFKYDIYNNSNNLVEVYDLAGNKAEYQVKLKDSDIPTIEEGLDALVNKSDSGKEDISYFRKIINDLDESMNKDLLQNRLNDIYPKTLTLDRELATSNMDVYIKSENILQMALDTNSITFEDFSGVEDIIRENAVNVSINSSLPYQLNAYLPVEIQNADKTNIMDKSILNIKENSESIYQVFSSTSDKLVLKDNCPSGNDLIHGIDIKLSGGIAHEKDVYKTTIKFEAEQK